MEFANVWSDNSVAPNWVRQATKEDTDDIYRLLDKGYYHHTHIDWFLPTHWLGQPTFLIHEPTTDRSRFSFTAKMFGDNDYPSGCLAVTAEPAPAAWVRLAAIHERQEPEAVLGRLFTAVIPSLRQTAVSGIYWLMVDPWPDEWLTAVGLAPVSGIETYTRHTLQHIPNVAVPQLKIRPATPDDLDQLEAIEANAFEPMWRHSAAALQIALTKCFRFDVAMLEDDIVGFQVSTRNRDSAHLARMTIVPAAQGKQVGSALLAHLLQSARRAGLTEVSLNTQLDNSASQHLYKKFGFESTGEQIPIWGMTL